MVDFVNILLSTKNIRYYYYFHQKQSDTGYCILTHSFYKIMNPKPNNKILENIFVYLKL